MGARLRDAARHAAASTVRRDVRQDGPPDWLRRPRANRHLNSYPDFRNAPGLINDARAVLERARKAESRAASLRGADPAGGNALRSLFAVEVHRAQGLYKGMVDSSNGGDYSYGFSEGTTASYAFDQANADFDRLYR